MRALVPKATTAAALAALLPVASARAAPPVDLQGHLGQSSSPLLSLVNSPVATALLALPLLVVMAGGPRNLLQLLLDLATSRRTYLVLAIGIMYAGLSGVPYVLGMGAPPLALNPRTRRVELISPSPHAQYGFEGLAAGFLQVLAAGCVALVVLWLPRQQDGLEGRGAAAEGLQTAPPERQKERQEAQPQQPQQRQPPDRDKVLLAAAVIFAGSIAALVAMFRRKNVWYQPLTYLLGHGGGGSGGGGAG